MPNENGLPNQTPRKKELHPKRLFKTALELHRSETYLSENKENIPPSDDKKACAERVIHEEEGYPPPENEHRR